MSDRRSPPLFDRRSLPTFDRRSLVMLAALAVGCSSAPQESTTSSSTEAMSSTIHSVYGLTVFGGPGDCQPLACGGANSCSSQPWYSASSQRYGCNVHLRVEANGKCVVVATEDAGPASWVESKAGVPILDASPAVAEHLFGVGSLGWSDLASHPGKYQVHVTETTDSLGPCDGTTSGSSSGGSGGSSGGSGGSSGSSGSSSGTSSGSGSGGSSGGSSGSSSGSGGSSGGGASGGGSGSSGSSGSGSGGSSGSSSGGPACSTDGDCNPGTDGSGQICVQHVCVDGCNADWECPGSTTCVSGQCQ